MNFVLCGLPKSGKTTIGTMVAEKLRRPFIDTDRLIEAAYAIQTGRRNSCRQIFLQEGETVFRALEKDQIIALQEVRNSIIALGGGSFREGQSMKILQSVGCIIYLKAPVKILFERVLLSGLPAYLNVHDPENDFYALAEARKPLYEKAAHGIVETNDLSIEEAVLEVLRACSKSSILITDFEQALKSERKIKHGE